MNSSYQNYSYSQNCSYKKQRGVTLLVALVLLLVMSMIAVTSLTTSTLEERMAINTQNQVSTFQAAESGVDNTIRDITTLTTASQSRIPGSTTTIAVQFSTQSKTEANIVVEFVRKDDEGSYGATPGAYETGTSWGDGTGPDILSSGSTYFQARGNAALKANAAIASSVMQGFKFGTSDR